MADPILIIEMGTRGEILFDLSKCDQCQDCERVCPSVAIKVYPEERKIEWNPFKCIYCHTCIRTCMHGAISPLDNVQASDYEKVVKTFE
jgi:formate hydrogenlyase subunit 6/NADH:ubiquinone oxidoreductase subunit I